MSNSVEDRQSQIVWQAVNGENKKKNTFESKTKNFKNQSWCGKSISRICAETPLKSQINKTEKVFIAN